MRRSSFVPSPVITLLSRSPATSRRAEELFQALFSMEPVRLDDPGRQSRLTSDSPVSDVSVEVGDEMDAMFNSAIPGLRSTRWDSRATRCRTTGTILHFLSLYRDSLDGNQNNGNSIDAATKSGRHDEGGTSLALLAITGDVSSSRWQQEESKQSENTPFATSAAAAAAAKEVLESRQLIASHIKQRKGGKMKLTALGMKLTFFNSVGRPIKPSHILGIEDGLPLMHLPPSREDGTNHYEKSTAPTATSIDRNETCHIREVVLPHFDDALYSSGLTLLSEFYSSGLTRPLVGLYRWPSEERNSVVFRPVPSAAEDRMLPPPSLVFQCANLNDMKDVFDEVGVSTARVGFSGNGKNGQLMIGHKDLVGLDIRLCDAKALCSFFAEAQEALLAGSLDDLQNANVMAEGGHGDKSEETDAPRRPGAMNGLGDCWMEFRANMKHPSGFFWRRREVLVSQSKAADRSAYNRTVKAPSIPYE